tara:strand:- start:264 stop:416 length:153 start_codon:yes stop_codon:yes gene_type:complete
MEEEQQQEDGPLSDDEMMMLMYYFEYATAYIKQASELTGNKVSTYDKLLN